jgi:hypothetical protein
VGYRPQIHVLSALCPQLNLLNPPEKNSGYASVTSGNFTPDRFTPRKGFHAYCSLGEPKIRPEGGCSRKGKQESNPKNPVVLNPYHSDYNDWATPAMKYNSLSCYCTRRCPAVCGGLQQRLFWEKGQIYKKVYRFLKMGNYKYRRWCTTSHGLRLSRFTI